jgi:lipopolysaccharide export system permease protein
LREVVMAWAFVTGVLLIILLGYQVAGVLERAAVNQYPQGVVLELISLSALQNLSLLVPFGLLVGILIAFGRLYHDSEMAAALACGIRPGRIYAPVGLLAVLVAAGLAWSTLGLAPEAYARFLSLRNAAVRAGQFAPLAAGKFRSFGGGSVVVYAQNVNKDGTLGNVFVERNRGLVVEVALARRGRLSVSPDGATHTITLYDVERYEGQPGNTEFRIAHFAEHTIPVQVPMTLDVVKNLEAQPSRSLWESRDPNKRGELHWRVAMPVSCLVLTLLAVPLARLRPRQGRYSRLWLALVIYLLYQNLINIGRVWISRERVPEVLGLWWTHAAVALLALVVIYGPSIATRIRYRARGL